MSKHKIKKFFHIRAFGFSLIEVLIAVAIIGLLISLSLFRMQAPRDAVNVVISSITQQHLTKATELYYMDVGFYPPDVNRGWDPGFVRALPWNPDAEAGDPPPGGFASPGTNCSHCPADWQDIVQEKWNGPYISAWPRFTAWNGKYDYNYWGAGANRYGCDLFPGIYIGVQGDYENNNTIVQSAEQKMIDIGFEAEQCINGESQMLLQRL
ncbi:MAG: type II secretion system protein [Candidatus Paceibacterota bacterium]